VNWYWIAAVAVVVTATFAMLPRLVSEQQANDPNIGAKRDALLAGAWSCAAEWLPSDSKVDTEFKPDHVLKLQTASEHAVQGRKTKIVRTAYHHWLLEGRTLTVTSDYNDVVAYAEDGHMLGHLPETSPKAYKRGEKNYLVVKSLSASLLSYRADEGLVTCTRTSPHAGAF
jgi:hypothetical protein